MDKATIARLAGSFDLVAPRVQELADAYYSLLFNDNPALRPLFPLDLTEQKRRLLNSLAALVSKLSATDHPEEVGVDLGHRRFARVQRRAQYAIARETLLEVMAGLAGGSWNPVYTRAWRQMLNECPSAPHGE